MTSLLIIALTAIMLCDAVYSTTNTLCPAVCSCDENQEEKVLKLDCSRAYLSIVLPVEDWPAQITHMDLSSNNISALDTELAHDTLQVLDLGHNHIRRVVQSAFGGLRTLKYLNLASNGIEEFEENGFYGLEHLMSLNLSGNRLKTMPDKLLYNFIGLQELSLSDNPLVHIDPIHFNRMINLKWLDLSDTGVYTLAPNIFHNTGQLQFLNLGSNEFHRVPTDALRSAKALTHLKLSGNPIESLDKSSFIKLFNLEVLELNFLDHITEIGERTFSDMAHLRSLEMKYCRTLQQIHPSAFLGLFNESSRPILQELDLEGNQLRKLHQNVVPCSRIRKLNLQKNPWICDCDIKWVKGCYLQAVYSLDFKCSDPERLRNALVVDVNDEDFTCKQQILMAEQLSAIHRDHVVRSISLGMAGGFLVVIALGLALLFKRKDIRTWYRNKRRGPGAVYYVRARANPSEI